MNADTAAYRDDFQNKYSDTISREEKIALAVKIQFGDKAALKSWFMQICGLSAILQSATSISLLRR
ncbi:MAG: hypothetical protein IEMM0003_0946 [bacterium]|nr:MAG: hypothetical protein IEMM0003_0946 [bacterium]